MSPKKKTLHNPPEEPKTVRFKNRKTGRETEALEGSTAFLDLVRSPDLFAVVPDKGTAEEDAASEEE